MTNRLRQIMMIALLGIKVPASAQVRHVILISIDGFHPDMYLDKDWPCPNLRYLMKHGTYADYLKSTFPSYTYPSHTAMVTGALPARSGINFNQPIGSHEEWYWYSKAIKVPTLWQVLKTASKTTAAIEWPVTVGADINWNLPEIWAVDGDDRIAVARNHATPGLVDEIEQNATGKLDSSNMQDSRFSLDENLGRVAAYILKKYRPDFLALHFACVDEISHEQGRDNDSVRMALAADDRAIGELLEAIQYNGLNDSTAIIIVGDHGFATINQVMRPNRLIENVPARFVASGGSAFLYPQVREIESDGPAVAERLHDEITRAVTDSLNQLPKDKRKLFRIIDRKELDRMGADSTALLALSAKPGMVFSSSIQAAQTQNHGPGTFIQQTPLDGVFVPAHGGHHGYDPDIPEMHTGFIACGAGIIKGGHTGPINEPDIAVLVARLLGVDFKTPDGKDVPGIVQ